MKAVHQGARARPASRKRRIRRRPTRSVPALSTRDAAHLVLLMVADQQRHGWPLDQIGWQRLCRDRAVIQVVQ